MIAGWRRQARPEVREVDAAAELQPAEYRPGRRGSFAAVPLLIVSAPFLIMRNSILGRRQEGRRFEFVFLATLIAGFWSLMSGLVLVMTLQACGFTYA
ncbi:MAG: hypothetical protein WB614_24540 [Pseudolabrys sp.]